MAKQGPTPKQVQNSNHLKEVMQNEASSRVPDDLIWDPEHPLPVNGCNGRSHGHVEGCDGSCEKKYLDEWDVKIENERRAWARMGIEPDANELRKEVQTQTIIRLLKQHLGIDDEAFNAIFKPLMYELLHSMRVDNEQAIMSAKIRSQIMIPGQSLQ